MILGHELKGLDAMNSSGLWMIETTPDQESNALDAMNSLGLWMT